MAVVYYQQGGFPPTGIDWSKLIPLIGPASGALARYDEVLRSNTNVELLLSTLMMQEAVFSSRIEGTQATMGQVFAYEAGTLPLFEDKQARARFINDVQEVKNYRSALKTAEAKLGELPISGRLIRGVHAVLLEGVRGRNKHPGHYRQGPTWIGPEGCKEEEARFVPIGADKLPDGMTRWEKYVNSDQPDGLVQLAVVHGEFEALHPFWDGNGRVGRMLIPLFLFTNKLLSQPSFYFSVYLESRQEDYYEGLLSISRDGDWTPWCVFFLEALTMQAQAITNKARQILDLYQEKKAWVIDRTHSQHAIRALDFIFDRPIFKTPDFVAHARIPEPTAKKLIRSLRDGGLLIPIREGAGRRAAVSAFPELLDIAEGADEASGS